ncbi:MAG: FkbM family methyltransferase [Nitrososphaerota archaeon]|nr:FkbM family methyltransferase [Nitrososphaerota archaeon]
MLDRIRLVVGIISYVRNWYCLIIYFAARRLGSERRVVLLLRNGVRFRYVAGSSLYNVIIRGLYGVADVRGRDVVDVGAFSGDSILAFHIRGARMVLGFEPYPYAYKIACENIEINGVKSATCVNAAIGGEQGEVIIDPNYTSSIGDQLRDFGNGVRIQVLTLDQVISRYHLSDAVLKLNCEGSEYGILFGSSNETLSAFSEIIVQYHFGIDGLVNKLVSCGYAVDTVQKEKVVSRRRSSSKTLVTGILIAKKSASRALTA